MESIDDAFTYEITCWLSRLPPSVPSPTDRAAVELAIGLARLDGLRFESPTVRYVFAPDKARGQFERANGGGHCVVSINLAECPTSHAVLEVMLHELQHVSDMQSGAYVRQTRAESERRAIAFAARVLAGG